MAGYGLTSFVGGTRPKPPLKPGKSASSGANHVPSGATPGIVPGLPSSGPDTRPSGSVPSTKPFGPKPVIAAGQIPTKPGSRRIKRNPRGRI